MCTGIETSSGVCLPPSMRRSRTIDENPRRVRRRRSLPGVKLRWLLLCGLIAACVVLFRVNQQPKLDIGVSFIRYRGVPPDQMLVFDIRNGTGKPVWLDQIELEGEDAIGRRTAYQRALALGNPGHMIEPRSTLGIAVRNSQGGTKALVAHVTLIPWTQVEVDAAKTRYSRFPGFVSAWLMRKYDPRRSGYRYTGPLPPRD